MMMGHGERILSAVCVCSTSAWTPRRLQRTKSRARTLALVAAAAGLTFAVLVPRTVAESSALASGRPGQLNGVSAESATDVWAVGYSSNVFSGLSKTLTLHWNGSTWSTVTSPNPAGTGTNDVNVLASVSAIAASNAWAVGSYTNSGGTRTLILHWDGSAWNRVASPNPGGTGPHAFNTLQGVSATSAHDAWAAGYYLNPTSGATETLTLRWNGTSWGKVASPSPGGTANSSDESVLQAVNAATTVDAWAVGSATNSTTGARESLPLHWDGAKWRVVASPNPGGTTSRATNFLYGVSAPAPTATATYVWAVGSYYNPAKPAGGTLVLRWDGTHWSRVASPNPGTGGGLTAVGTAPGGGAWAVGSAGNPSNSGSGVTLTLHWNGSRWVKVASPNPGGTTNPDVANLLSGVSATAASDAWAVGRYENHSTNATGTIVLHWNGTGWSEV